MNTDTNIEELKKVAFSFAGDVIKKGYEYESIHEYQDIDGRVLYWRLRFKNHETDDKYIRPIRRLECGKYEMKEPDFDGKKPLYNLYSLATASSSSDVYVVEGEKCVDALTSIGVLATTSGSADSVSQADWQILAGRKVIVWPDNDEPGGRFLNSAIDVLGSLNCEVWQIDINTLNLSAKGDIVDWLALNPNTTADDIAKLCIIKSEPKSVNQKNDNENSQNKREKQSSILVDFVIERAELFHDETSKTYAQNLLTKETYQLDSSRFSLWLTSSHYEEFQKIPNDSSIKEALNVLRGIALFRGSRHKVYIRTAKVDDAYYIDLAIPHKSHAVCITSSGWDVVENPPIKFVRLDSMQSLPIPVCGGDLSSLWKLINIPKNSRLLVIAWLIDVLRPETPFPVLELTGEQGSAKSTTQILLKRLIDPSICDLRGAPKTVEDVYVSAAGNWVQSYENISYLSPQMQDAFCVISTGGGFAKRKNYTDADESVIVVKRPAIINGINAVITAQDLIDRAISIELPRITSRKEIEEIRHVFEEKHGAFLGALLDIFVRSLSRLSMVQLPNKNCPRLIEYTRLGIAISEIQGETACKFLSAFNDARVESITRAIDASPVALALVEFFEAGGKQTIACQLNVLLARLEHFKQGTMENWPRTAKGLGDVLRRMAPALRQIGIECASLGKINGYVHWEIKKCD